MRSLLVATAATEDWRPQAWWGGRSRIGALAGEAGDGLAGAEILRAPAPAPTWEWHIWPQRANLAGAHPAGAGRLGTLWELVW
jgi:hypothetical protein